MAREVQASALVRVLVHWRRCWYGGAAVCVWFCFLSVPDLLAMVGAVLGSIRGLVSRHYRKNNSRRQILYRAGISSNCLRKWTGASSKRTTFENHL